MIIDLILDRKDNEKATGRDTYSAGDFYREVMEYESIFEMPRDISRTMDEGTENDVKKRFVIISTITNTTPKLKNISIVNRG